jgi:UPF0755 protein
MKKIIKIVIASILIVFFFISVSYFRGINSSASRSGVDIVFNIEKGKGVKQISRDLYNQGLIKSRLNFQIYVWQKGLENKMQAGEYILNPILSVKEIVKILAVGKAMSNEREIKIIDGWNISDIANYFEKEGLFKKDDFYNLAGYPESIKVVNSRILEPKDYSAQFDFLADKPKSASLEGYLFPDTYRIFNNAALDDVILKLLDNFDKKISSEMRAEIKKQNKSIYEIVTMASIIEKEVKTYEDMRIVSGVFWDRIKNGQALESCATLAYILGKNKPQYTQEDTEIDSLYNTYKNRGLTPGPICNPGLNAIKAAIYPEYTDYNYFLSATDDGKTIFSKTYEEHLRNKVKYLK